jgi:ketosteroid isomerase-like protein
MTHPASSPQQVLVRELLSAVDRRDALAANAFFAEKVVLVFGNDEPVPGRQGALETMTAFLGAVGSIRHEITTVFAESGDEDHVVARMTVHYELSGGEKFALPCCNTFRLSEGKITEYHVYMDVTPVAAAMRAA